MFAGYVCLIGAGPGNPGLVTRRGLEYLKEADLVLYDQLIPASLLLEVKKGCRLLEVGKQGGKLSWNQDAINELLIAEAQAGQFVVRLKGGDPFLLGRGGEEAQALAEAGIPFFIVPGVSSSYAVPAYAGIPVTDRRYCSGVTVATGHRGMVEAGQENNRGDETERAHTERAHTLVFLMALTNLNSTITGLIQQGWAGHTPAAVISQGTKPGQKVVAGKLAELSGMVERAALPAPALMVVGDVVKLQEIISWSHHLPLFGKRILWTRASGKDEPHQLKEFELYGAEVVRFPTVEIQPAPLEYVKNIFSEIGQFTWLVFTSSTAVEIFCRALVGVGWDWRQLGQSRIAVIGKKTSQALAERGRIPDLTAADSNSDGLLSALLKELGAGDRVALCRARQTLPNLEDGLRARASEEAGILYKSYDLYEVIAPAYDPAVIQRIFSEPFDVVVHTSPSSVVNLGQILAGAGYNLDAGTQYACLGMETAAACRRAGIEPWLVPEEPDIEGLLEKILEKYLATETRRHRE